jgi:hypothetical protein
MFVSCVYVLYVVLSGVGSCLSDGLVTRPEEPYRVSNCVSLGNLNTKEDKAQLCAVVP